MGNLSGGWAVYFGVQGCITLFLVLRLTRKMKRAGK